MNEQSVHIRPEVFIEQGDGWACFTRGTCKIILRDWALIFHVRIEVARGSRTADLFTESDVVPDYILRKPKEALLVVLAGRGMHRLLSVYEWELFEACAIAIIHWFMEHEDYRYAH